jgi:hypothetical protein
VKLDNLYDDPEDLHDLMTTGFCHDCSVPYGDAHHVGCDMERCPICRDQFISCGHNFQVRYFEGPYDDGTLDDTILSTRGVQMRD